MNIKKYTEKDRYGNMFSYEFDVPSMQEIPQPNPEIFKPKGTDTVPAMLTPGENVVNAEASRLPGVQPMLDELNNKGRAIQKKQGGPIPSYNAEGGVITEDMMPSVLDSMRMVESGGNPNAVSEVGAAGPYQIMKATGMKPGYGVEAISGADRFNEVKSRNFAKQYLQGIMKSHPEFTKDEVITAYHSGVGNVLKAKSGEEELGPRGKAYAGKVSNAMPTTKIITLDGRDQKPGFMSAQASTKDTSDKGVPDYIKGIPPEDISTDTSETGLGNQIMNKLGGGEFDLDKAFGGKQANPFNTDTTFTDIYNTITDAPGEIYDIVKDKATEVSRAKDLKRSKQFLVDADKNVEYYKEKFDNEPNAANEKKLKDAIKNQKKILKIVEKRSDSVEKLTSDKEEEKKKYAEKSSEDIINEKNTNDPELNKIKGIFSAITDVPKDNNKVNPNKVKEKEPEADPTLVEKMTGWFGDVFKDMFSGPELARMAVSYVASRALGYDHGNSLDHSAKQYIKRVDEDISERQKFITNKDNLKTFTTESLKEYRETGDVSKLKRIKQGLVAQGTGPMIYHDKHGPLPTFRTGKDTYAVEYNGQLYPYNHPEMMGFTSTYDKELHEPQKVSDFFKNRGVSSIKGANKKITEEGKGIDEGLAASTADKAANRYLKDAQLYGGDPAARSQLRLQMIKAQEEFWIDYGIAVKNGTTAPNDVLAYYNKRAIPMKTKGVVSNNDFENANAQAVQKLDNIILRASQFSKDKTKRVNPQVEAKQYKQIWGALKLNWDANSPGSKWAERMPDDGVKGNGIKNNSFTYWASKVLDTNAKEHDEAMKLLTNKFQLKSNQR